MTQDLQGKNILVTGATEGIGKAAALEFARRGASLTIVGRNPEKTAKVLEALKAAGAKDAVSILGDLSVLADIRSVAKAYRDRVERIDVLVNNAGAVFTSYATTPDGFERTFALNHLGYFLLTR